MAIVSSASISSVTFMVPISAANAEPERPITTMAVIRGPSSRDMEIGDGGGNIVHRAKAPKLVRALKRENQSNKKCNQRKNRQSADAYVHGLRDGALQTKRLALKRADKRVIRRTAPERGKRADVGQAIRHATANL